MKHRIAGVLAAAAGVAGSAAGQQIFAAVIAVLFLALVFAPVRTTGAKTLLLCAGGFSLVLSAGNFVIAGITAALVLLTVLGESGLQTGRYTLAAAAAAGILAAAAAAQTYMLIPLLAAFVLICLGIFILFVREYRLTSESEGDGP
jgi:uncharacterized membrane protein